MSPLYSSFNYSFGEGDGTPRIVTDGLVLNLDAARQNSYSGGTTWRDLSGRGNNGTLVNGVGYVGTNGGSLSFDGVDDYVNLNSSPSLNFGTLDFAISWWENPFSIQSGTIRKFGNLPNRVWSANDWVIGQSNSTNFQFYVYNYNSVSPMFNTSIVANIWQNIIVARSGNTWSLFINTISPISSITSSVSLDGNTSRSFYIGTSGLLNEFWKGNISQVSIYNRALSASEIQQNFNATRGRYGV